MISAGEDITITIIILTPSRPDPTERRFRPIICLSLNSPVGTICAERCDSGGARLHSYMSDSNCQERPHGQRKSEAGRATYEIKANVLAMRGA